MHIKSSETRESYWIWESSILAALLLFFHYGLELGIFSKIGTSITPQWTVYLPFLKKLSIALFAVCLIFLIGRIIEKIIDSRAETEGVRYNLIQITRLISVVLIIIIAASFLFQNLYAAVVSFGLISLVLGFALQAPITSFIAWLYIVFRRPYHVGDRIQIGNLKGDVVEISYLDTIIEEVSGIYLGNDRLSGRKIHFPNSIVLKSEIINYSGPFGGFIWNETAIQIAYTSNLNFVETCLIEATEIDFTEKYPHLKSARKYHPEVYFRVNQYAWLEAVISYPVEPTDTTGRRNRILRRAISMLNQEPEKVKFPEGSSR